MDEVKRPPALPAGTYFGSVEKQEYGESNNKKTPYCRFHIKLNSAGEDVEKDSLEGIDLAKKQLRKDYYLTPDAEYRLKEFLESCGIPTAGRSLGECVPDALNQPIIAEVLLRPNQQDPDAPPNNEIGNLKGQNSEG